MGRAAEGTLPRHSCMRVATGAMLPEGADAVVMMEHTEMVDDATVAVLRPVAPGETWWPGRGCRQRRAAPA